VGEVQGSHGDDLQAAELDATVATVMGVVGDGDRAPGQGGQLAVEAGLVGLHDQYVVGLLDADQPVGVGMLDVERIGSDHGGSEVQPLQQRLELSDLVGGVLHVGLAQDGVAGVVHRREQMHRCRVVVAAAAQGLAVDRDRPLRPGR
jgi:hypothetical protein